MNEELGQSFSSGIFTLFTFLYWINLLVWIFFEASESSKKAGDTSGGAFMGALLIHAFIAYLLWFLTAALADANYAWINLIIFAAHMYWAYIRHRE